MNKDTKQSRQHVDWSEKVVAALWLGEVKCSGWWVVLSGGGT
jgi:hypothetical protein